MYGGDVSMEGKVTYLFEEGGEPVRIAVHPSGDDFVCSTTTGCNHEDNIKFVCKDFPPQDVGPQKCMAFSVDGSKLAIGGVDGHFRLFEWPTMRIIVDEPKAHKSFRDMDFSAENVDYILKKLSDGKMNSLLPCPQMVPPEYGTQRDGVRVTLSRNAVSSKQYDVLPVRQLVIHFYVDVIVSCLPHCRMRIFSSADFSKDGTNPNKTLIAVWDISTWKKIGHKSLYNKPASIMTISLDGKYLALGSKNGDVCVIDVTKMEISSLHKRLHLGTNITSLEFCPSESEVCLLHIFHM
ncbi:hypothetical protein H5410_005522 [Solanum commersonii]|uniref:Uncharacterized protein n=1 Tax=Solanum commersonii TaxID=4109 RepID=A0A9J6A7E1_SOLCO|nr:hypothetical protein H5410_005522 [Solanum commersonii]